MLTIQARIQMVVPRLLGPMLEFQGCHCEPRKGATDSVNEPHRKCATPQCVLMNPELACVKTVSIGGS